MRYLRLLLSLLFLLHLSACGGGGGGGSTPAGTTPSNPLPQVTLVRLELSPTSLSLPQGITTPVRAFAVFSNGVRVEVTQQSAWSSRNPAVARVQAGRIEGVAQGHAEVEASLEGRSATLEVDVTAALLQSLELDPPTATLPRGLSQTFLVFGHFSDGSRTEVTPQVQFQLANPALASLAGNQVTALNTGNTTLTATLSGQSAQAQLICSAAILQSLQIEPNPGSIPRGLVQAFHAFGNYSDGSQVEVTTQASWSSQNQTQLEVSNLPGSIGQALALQQGQTTLTATFGGLQAQVAVQVTAAVLRSLELSSPQTDLPVGLEMAITATGVYSDGERRNLTEQALWSTQPGAQASVSNAPTTAGTVRGLAEGAFSVQADFGGLQASLPLQVVQAILQSLEIRPGNPSIPKGLSRSLSAWGSFSDNQVRDLSDQVTWSSLSPAQCTVDQTGQAQALEIGNATIQVRLASQQAQTQVTVTAALLVELQMSPRTLSLPRGLSQPLRVDGRYSDGQNLELTEQVHWSSDHPTIASVSNLAGEKGTVRALDPGQCQIVADLDGQTATCNATVAAARLESIDLSPTLAEVRVGSVLPMLATGHYSDSSQRSLTESVLWSSSNTSILTVSNQPGSSGQATGVGSGNATLTATLEGVQSQVSVSVLEAHFSGEQWSLQAGLESLAGVAFGNQTWVAAGQGSRHLVSSDAVHWTPHSVYPFSYTLSIKDVAYGNGVFLLQGQLPYALPNILGPATSPDGITWTIGPSNPLTPLFTFVCSGAGVFRSLLADDRKLLARSNDGLQWNVPIGTAQEFLQSVNGRFLRSEVNAGHHLWESLDGSNWTDHLLPFADPLTAVAFGDGIYVFGTSTGKFKTTSDFVTWTDTVAPGRVASLAFGNHRFVALGKGDSVNHLRTWRSSSADGSTWASAELATTDLVSWNSVAFGNGLFTCVGSGQPIDTSADGINWNHSGPGLPYSETGSGFQAAYGSAGYLLLASQSDTAGVTWVHLSPDGTNWTSSQAVGLPAGVARLGFFQDHYLAEAQVLNLTRVFESSDGVHWSLSSFGKLPRASGLGLYVHCDDNGVSWSTDGVTWTPGTGQVGRNHHIAFGGGRFVMVGGGLGGRGNISFSDDGKAWTPVMQTILGFADVAWGGGMFVAVGTEGDIWSSPDGSHWTRRQDPTSAPYVSPLSYWYRVLYGHGLFVACGIDGEIATSSDGISWTHRESGTRATLDSGVSGPSRILLTGQLYRITSP